MPQPKNKDKKLDQEYRARTTSSIQAWGNMVFIGMVVAQFIPVDTPINLPLILIGLLGLVLAYYVAERIMKGGEG